MRTDIQDREVSLCADDQLTRDVLTTLETASLAHAVAVASGTTTDAEILDGEDDDICPVSGAFNVYEDVKRALIERGIPAEQIAFIQQHNTKTKRAKLFDDVNAGRIRVLLVSKQSTGMNVQRLLIGLHNLDVPWRPGDLEQRLGRMVRQGNLWPEVYGYNYATEGSFDGYMWQTLYTKANFIEQFERGDVTTREIDDIGGLTMSAAEMKAIASGNPKIIRKVTIEMELGKLDGLYRSYRDTQAHMRWALRDNELKRVRGQELLALYTAAHTQTVPYAEKKFRMALTEAFGAEKAVTFDKREEAGKAVLELCANALESARQEYDRTYKEANTVTFGDTERARKLKVGVPPISQTRMIGAYAGLNIMAWVHSGNGVEVYLTMDDNGCVTRIPSATITADSPRGVFQSIDARIRRLADDVVRLTTDIAKLADEDAKLTASLGQAWEYDQVYAELRTELDQLNLQFGIGKQDNESEIPLLLADDDAEAFAEDEDGVPEFNTDTMLMMVRPDVFIPAPADSAAMEAARSRIVVLRAEQTLRDAAQSAIVLAPVEADEAEIEDVVLPSEADEPMTITFAPENVIIPASVPVSYGKQGLFGDLTLIAQSRKRGGKQGGVAKTKPAAETPSTGGLEQFGLFSLAAPKSAARGGQLSFL